MFQLRSRLKPLDNEALHPQPRLVRTGGVAAMTLPDPKRTATVNIGAQPKSSAYERAKRGPLAVSAWQLKEGASNVTSRKDHSGVQRSFLGVRAPRWYLNTRALLDRSFEYQEPIATCAAGLGISIDEAQSIITQAISVGEHKIGLKFQPANNSNAKYPRSPKDPCVKLLAEKIALRLDALAQDSPGLVEEGVFTYISNVQKNEPARPDGCFAGTKSSEVDGPGSQTARGRSFDPDHWIPGQRCKDKSGSTAEITESIAGDYDLLGECTQPKQPLCPESSCNRHCL
jgi:hypothetical protein